MIVALWLRWIQQGQWWWLAILAGVLLADVFVGSWLLAKEIELMREVWR